MCIDTADLAKTICSKLHGVYYHGKRYNGFHYKEVLSYETVMHGGRSHGSVVHGVHSQGSLLDGVHSQGECMA